uniref:Uncharacterized protein n=1 Tax=Rhizophora mucronata TaxID=61149 RepID=A0A2P2NA57_RHIMU
MNVKLYGHDGNVWLLPGVVLSWVFGKSDTRRRFLHDC